MPRPRRLLAIAAGAALIGVPAVLTASPAAADHTPIPSRVTLMGSLMSELGCGSDWDETCTKTDLLPVPGSPTLFAGTFTVPAGDPAAAFDYVYKVRLNGSWTENYGDATFGVPDGNIPLAIDKTTILRFTYDHATHRVRVGPAEPAGGLTRADRAMAGDSLRKDLTREKFYFVMADRFENGRTANDSGGLAGVAAADRLRPDQQGVLPRWRPQGHDQQARLHPGPGHHRDLADAVRSRTSRCRAPRARRAPATTATGSPTSPRSTRTSAPTPS